MEQGQASLKPGFIVENSAEFNVLERPEELSPEVIDEFVKISSLDIATKFYDATDGLVPIEVQHYQALFENGWAASRTEEIIRVFGDWATFQGEAATQRSEQSWDRWRDKQRILAEADQVLAAGAVPAKLFKKVEQFISPEQPRQKTLKNGETRVVNDSGMITDTDVTPEEKITRYCKYKLAKDILAGVGKHPSEARLLGMALGIFINDLEADSGSLSSSFNSEIKKVGGEIISLGAIEIKADSLGLFDYVYPDVRAKTLTDVRQASGYAPPAAEYTAPEIHYDVITKSSIIGRSALESCLSSGSPMSNIYNITEVLMDKTIPVDGADRLTNKYADWGRSGMAAYGQWVLSLTSIANNTVFDRAGRMGIGPSMSSIIYRSRSDRFPNRTEFYKAIDATKKNPPGLFSEMTLDDCVAYVQSIAPKYNGKISEPVLKREYEEAKKSKRNVPSYRSLVSVAKLSDILKAAGLPVRQAEYGNDGIIARGLRFYDEHGRVPTKRDYALTAYLPKPNTLLRYCGGIKGFQQKILEAVNEREIVLSSIAASEELAA